MPWQYLMEVEGEYLCHAFIVYLPAKAAETPIVAQAPGCQQPPAAAPQARPPHYAQP